MTFVATRLPSYDDAIAKGRFVDRDCDDPLSLGEVGHCGVAIDSAADMDILFDGINLQEVTTSMTISGPAVPCRAEATLGEICNTLRDEWGIYRELGRF